MASSCSKTKHVTEKFLRQRDFFGMSRFFLSSRRKLDRVSHVREGFLQQVDVELMCMIAIRKQKANNIGSFAIEKALTNHCTATPPALASFGIIARYNGVGGFVGLDPAAHGAGRAREWRR
jgi:hypothetical protein